MALAGGVKKKRKEHGVALALVLAHPEERRDGGVVTPRVAVLVVDSLNAPKAMLRDDGTSPSTAEAAKMKATSAMLYNRPSGPPQQPPPGTTAPPATIPGTINSLGGVPIKFGDVTIGAVGVSGAPGGDKDAACANAALAKLADRLK